MVNVITILFESIATWLCLHIVFGKRIEKRWLELGLPIIHTLLFSLCSFEVLGKACYFIIIILTFSICKVQYKSSSTDTLARMLVGIIFVGVIEVIVTMMFSYILINVGTDGFKCVLTSATFTIIAYLLYLFIVIRDSYKLKVNKYIFLFIVVVYFLLLYVKSEFEVNKKIDVIYICFFVCFAVAFIYMNQEQKKIHLLEKEKLKYELHDLYGNAYEELLEIVRCRQHDYKNQISALNSMYLTADNMDELREMHEQYLTVLHLNSKYDSILTKCNNSILAGYLYNMCTKCDSDNITVNLELSVADKKICEKTKDVIEILGVLLTNSIEALDYNNILDKIIKLKVINIKDEFVIEISNEAPRISFQEIQNIFSSGYSTKGERRGIGLFSLKKIVEKYNGEVTVNNYTEYDDNWIKFAVTI